MVWEYISGLEEGQAVHDEHTFIIMILFWYKS